MLKTWEYVKKDLDLVKDNKNKSILLGNGFTTACINLNLLNPVLSVPQVQILLL